MHAVILPDIGGMDREPEHRLKAGRHFEDVFGVDFEEEVVVGAHVGLESERGKWGMSWVSCW